MPCSAGPQVLRPGEPVQVDASAVRDVLPVRVHLPGMDGPRLPAACPPLGPGHLGTFQRRVRSRVRQPGLGRRHVRRQGLSSQGWRHLGRAMRLATAVLRAGSLGAAGASGVHPFVRVYRLQRACEGELRRGQAPAIEERVVMGGQNLSCLCNGCRAGRSLVPRFDDSMWCRTTISCGALPAYGAPSGIVQHSGV